MKLVKIDPVGLKLPQRQIKVVGSTLGSSLGGFCGNDHLVSNPFQSNPKFFLARRIHVGRIEKRDPQIEAMSDNRDGIFYR